MKVTFWPNVLGFSEEARPTAVPPTSSLIGLESAGEKIVAVAVVKGGDGMAAEGQRRGREAGAAATQGFGRQFAHSVEEGHRAGRYTGGRGDRRHHRGEGHTLTEDDRCRRRRDHGLRARLVHVLQEFRRGAFAKAGVSTVDGGDEMAAGRQGRRRETGEWPFSGFVASSVIPSKKLTEPSRRP